MSYTRIEFRAPEEDGPKLDALAKHHGLNSRAAVIRYLYNREHRTLSNVGTLTPGDSPGPRKVRKVGP